MRSNSMRKLVRAAPVWAAVMVCSWAASASAQSAPAAAPRSASPPAAVTPPPSPPVTDEDLGATLVVEHGHRVYVAHTAIHVPGEPQRPYAFDVPGRGALGYSYLEPKVHLVEEIVASARQAPFGP